MTNIDKEMNYLENNFNEEQITLKDILRKLYRGKWWIIIFSFLSLLVSIYFTYSTPPIYQATATVMIEKNSKANALFNFNANNNFKMSDEVAVIRSRTISEDVVEALWNSNKRNRLYVFGTKAFVPRGQRLRRPIKKILTLGKWTPEKSKPPKYYDDYSKKIGEKYYRNILNSLQIGNKRGTNIIQISVNTPHPYESTLIANLVAEAYRIRDKEWSSNESTSLNTFLQDRLNEKEFEIESIDEKIKQYKLNNEIYDLDGNVANLLNSLTSVESKFNNTELEINILHSQKKYYLDQVSDIEKDLTNKMLNSINSQLFNIRTQVDDKESELLRNKIVYGEQHEAVQKTTQELESLKLQLKNKTDELISAGLSIIDPLEYRQDLMSNLLIIETDLHQLETKNKEYKKLIQKYKNEIKLLPEKQSYLGKLKREKEVLSKTYSFMRQKMEEARVSMASEPGKVRIVNKAEEPSRPISPDISKNLLMGIVLGSLIGLGIHIGIEYFDNTVKSIEFIERKNLAVLSIIPSISNHQVKDVSNSGKNILASSIGSLQRRLITHEDPKSPISESYRSLRTSLMYTKKGGHGVIMVSSPGPGEGKTTTIINLAITYANLGKKTLLIDGDLRKPVLNKIFKIKATTGLTEYLSEVEKDWKSIINNTDIPDLDIIYSGTIPPNPSELLGSHLMRDFVEILKNKYEVILFDAPPIMAVTDAVVLSRLIDQFILVVRFGRTDKDSIKHTLTSLSNIDIKLTGVVLNDLNTQNSYYSKNYYNYHQYYYSDEESS